MKSWCCSREAYDEDEETAAIDVIVKHLRKL